MLAPGGTIQSIETAMEHGADAVYLGVGSLNARARAENLTEKQLPGIVEFVHSFESKVYVTMNIPVTTVNAKETARILALCREAGADAIIARDPVLMKTARAITPDLPVHASTQAGVHSVETARHMADLGCRRVILARECSRRDIEAIRTALPELEVEVFVFGAMCFGISGLCMMGHAVSGRSGNYGSCCQSCRLPYFSDEGNSIGFAFSMKDMDLTSHIPELVQMGVHSLKIEGRLKTPAWVGCVTHWLRAALNKPESGLTADEADKFNREISVLYSRPRTDAWFRGVTDASEILSIGNQTHTGLDVPIFRVVRGYDGPELGFITPVDINIRDGLLVKIRDEGAPEGASFIPMGIRTLLDGRGRTTVRIAADRDVCIPLGEDFADSEIIGVAIHSADSVRAKYRKVETHVDACVAENELPRPEFTRVEVTSETISASMKMGRFHADGSVHIESEPARSGGLDEQKLIKYFGPASYDIQPGLFINPTLLKSARRELNTTFETSRDESINSLEQKALSHINEQAESFYPNDDDLLARGNNTAAISRVTGMTAGRVFTSSGDGFIIEPEENVTRIRKI